MDELIETEADESAAPLGPSSERVRISGAEVAGERTGELPVVSRTEAAPATGGAPSEASVHVTGEPATEVPPEGAVRPIGPGQTAVPGGAATSPALPHWTEPPTGEVPAVLARDTGEGKSLMGPTWREEDADWVAHEEEFEPSMFGGDHAELGSLDESDRSAAERRPWEFDLDRVRPGDPGPSAHEPITEEVPAVRAEGVSAAAAAAAEPDTLEPDAETRASDAAFERVMGEPTSVAPVVPAAPVVPVAPVVPAAPVVPVVPVVAAAAAEGPSSERPVVASLGDDVPSAGVGEEAPARARPAGTTRLGRARRNGLRMRAKRPEDVAVLTETPLAAEPPGAAVTEVPGAGRKRSLADLAAGDRTGTEPPPVSDYELPPETHVGVAVTTAAAATATEARPRRRLAAPRLRAPADPTGGGPPRPPRHDPESAEPAAGASARGSSLGVRIGTGLAVAAIGLIAFKLGTVPTVVLAIILVTFAAGECFGVLRRAGYHPATLLGLLATVALMWGAYAKGVAAIPAVLVLLVAFTLIWYLIGIEQSPVAGTAATLLTVGWVSLLGAYAALLLAPSIFPERHGIAFLLGAVIAAATNDVSALAIGSWIGTRPLAPRISPHKTWEGLVGSAVVTVVVCTVVVGAIHPWDAATAAVLGLVVAVVAPLGDLCESLLKRDLRVKDMGTLLPGHGGVLDRIDALIFVVPATYYLVLALHIH
ncbi:MAG: phosphatidate cytidylyltransferase [Acidimicrobiales bacterium]|nr:phosphatidate cytidylyltransferase [Acidimicrobiales bacterium]